jgi:hypothetical protein
MDQRAEPPQNHGVDLEGLTEKARDARAAFEQTYGFKNQWDGPVTSLPTFSGPVLTGDKHSLVKSFMESAGAIQPLQNGTEHKRTRELN